MSILTSGIAMAAYVCPQLAPAPQMEMAMDAPCTGMDNEKPVHCAEFQSSAQLALEHLAAPPALTPVFVAIVWPAPTLAVPAIPAFSWDHLPSTYGADPPYLQTQRLRI